MKARRIASPAGLIGIMMMLAATLSSSASPEAATGTDADAVAFIQTDINGDGKLKGASIQVALDGGIAILTGNAVSLAQAERAAARAIASETVKGVVNQVRVGTEPSNAILRQAKAVLREQKMVRAEGIRVSARDGRVILSGEVGTWDEKELVRELVSEVPGVASIDNRIGVNFEGVRTDAQIGEQLRFMIGDDPLYQGLHLTATVKDGTVRLGGQVGSRGEYDRLVRRCYVTGVMDVQISGLAIDSDLVMEGLEDKDYSRDDSLAALKRALEKDNRVQAGEIHLAMADGVMTLSGKVRALSEKEAAESTARAIPGVLRVENGLKIGKPGEITGEKERIIAAATPPVPAPVR